MAELPNFADRSRVFRSNRRLRSPERSTVDGLGREAASSWPGSDVLQRGGQNCPAAFVQFISGSRSRT